LFGNTVIGRRGIVIYLFSFWPIDVPWRATNGDALVGDPSGFLNKPCKMSALRRLGRGGAEKNAPCGNPNPDARKRQVSHGPGKSESAIL
jgi:hypothetical protein